MKSLKNFIQKQDLKLVRVLNIKIHKHFINPFMVAITALGTVTFTCSIFLLTLFVDLKIALQFAVHLSISQLIVHTLKRTCKRPRPHQSHNWIKKVRKPPKDFSLPSGHTACFMTIALFFSSIFPNLFIPLMIIAILVGISRVYLGCHYPTDVLLGFFISITCYKLIAYYIF